MKARMLLTLGIVVASTAGLVGLPLEVAHATPVVVAEFPGPDDAEVQLLDLLNGERTSRGLPALLRTATLDGFAHTWSDFMSTGGCVQRDGRRLCQQQDLARMANAAYPGSWTKVGESVGLVPAGGTLESLHQAFMNSTLQRNNVLDTQFNAIGVGVTFDADGTLFVAFEFVGALDNPASPVVLPEPPPGLSAEDALLFYINDARRAAGLAPLARHAILDREAAAWSGALAGGTACKGTVVLCHSKQVPTISKTAVGARGTRWWAENVGVRWGVDVMSQFLGFMRSKPHRANMMRPNANLIGIGIAVDPLGRAFTTLQLIQARNPAVTTPPGGSSCGWLPNSLRKGAKGAYVRTLQCALTAAGVYSGPLDGFYTDAVANAVKLFQAQHGMKRPSGRADLTTRRMLGAV